ncbi:UNVERIFIED_CONTAM: hypothetical protein Sradi_6893300 [Sesamum radiatum]|uniref:Uncharacterized protein n=1 Tax=Sesamum radiatum TaxID=300843 RepID=A0AAW2JJ80_SESRA
MGTGMSHSASSSGASTFDGVATRAPVLLPVPELPIETICWIAPNKLGQFLRRGVRGGAVAWGISCMAYNPRRWWCRYQSGRSRSSSNGSRGHPDNHLQSLGVARGIDGFCLFAVLLRASIESHILNYVFP